MNTNAPRIGLLALLFALPFLGACGGGGGGDDGGESGTMDLSVTDAPVDGAEKVVVEFTGVTLKPQNGDEVVINYAAPKQIDLLALQGNDSELLLDGQVVPAGPYNWIRLHVNADVCETPLTEPTSGSYIVLGDPEVPGDETFETLVVPSGSQSGLKLVSGFTVAAGGLADFTIDFDLRKSVNDPQSAAQCHHLKPALRLVNNAQVGTLMGTVDEALITDEAACGDTDPATGSAVYVYQGAGVTPDDVDGVEPEPLTSAFVTFNGETYEYTVGFLLAGDYTVALTCQADADDPEANDAVAFQQPANISIVANQDTVHDFTAPPAP